MSTSTPTFPTPVGSEREGAGEATGSPARRVSEVWS